MKCELREAVVILESQSVEDFQQRFPVFILHRSACKDQSLGLDNFVKNAFHRIDCAIRPAHVDSHEPAGSHVQFAHGVSETAWSPPSCHLLRIGPGLEDKSARRAIDARKEEFLPGLASGGTTFCFGHVSSPWLAPRLGSRASGQDAVPTPYDSSLPSQLPPSEGPGECGKGATERRDRG